MMERGKEGRREPKSMYKGCDTISGASVTGKTSQLILLFGGGLYLYFGIGSSAYPIMLGNSV